MKGVWQNIICILAALWLCISPLVLHFRLESVVSDDTDIIGFFIGILSIIAIATPQVWEEWAKVILGVWLLTSPWFLGFGHQIEATGDIMIVSILVVMLSLWSLANRSLASRSSERPTSLAPTATQLLVHTMNMQKENTDVEKPN
jgi:hypothetical protein